jgi:hypothetical protein
MLSILNLAILQYWKRCGGMGEFPIQDVSNDVEKIFLEEMRPKAQLHIQNKKDSNYSNPFLLIESFDP